MGVLEYSVKYALVPIKPLLPGYLIKKCDEMATIADKNREYEWRHARAHGQEVGAYPNQEGNCAHNFVGVAFEILSGVALYGGILFSMRNHDYFWAMLGGVSREFVYAVAQSMIFIEKKYGKEMMDLEARLKQSI